MNYNETLEELVEQAREDLDTQYTKSPINNKKQFIVLYKGKQVTTTKNSSIWDSIANAKKSLHYHMKSYTGYSNYRTNPNVKPSDIINELLASGDLEFKEI